MSPSCRRKTKGTRRSSSRTNKHCLRSRNSSAVSPAISPAKTSNGDNDAENLNSSCNSICSTPKAERCRIPEITTCPPAPKKRRTRAATCSLRRTPLVFFAPPDIELFFYLALRGIPLIRWISLVFVLIGFAFCVITAREFGLVISVFSPLV